MDNSKYHKNIPDDTPRMGWKKTKLLGEWSKQVIQVPYKSIKYEIWTLLEPFIRDTLPIICAMSKAEGREVLFSSPHYSDLQLIKVVGANIKSGVGWKYTTQTNFKYVLVHLKESFTNLNSHTVQGCINHAKQRLKNCTNTFLTSTMKMKTNTAMQIYMWATLMATIMSMATAVMVKPNTSSKVAN